MAKKVVTKSFGGFYLGIVFAAFHAIWSLLVITRAAQWIMDSMHKLHFISSPCVVTPFDFELGLLGLGVAFASGFVLGWLLVWLYEQLEM